MLDCGAEAVSVAQARDGAEIAYKILKGSGPHRVVLVHSLAMDHRFWAPVGRQLHDLGDVLIYDCRGHGRSSGDGAPFSGDQFANDLADLLDAVGWDDAIVAGASMGGCIAIAFAAAYPDRTRALGLFDTTAWYGAEAPEQWEERAQKAIQSGLEVLVGFQKSRWFSEGFSSAHPEIVQDCVDIFLANDIANYVETCRMLGQFNKTDALVNFAMPVRIAVGSNDYATPPSMAEAMHKAIRGSTLETLDGAAHLTPLERRDDIARILSNLAGVA